MGIDAIKLKARRDLHRAMQRTAYCFLGVASGRFRVVNVRVHNDWSALGDVAGTSLIYAERREGTKQQIIFLAEERRPHRGDMVILSEIEGYRVDDVDPQYNLTIRTGVVSLSPAELAMFKAPPDQIMYMDSMGYLPTVAGEATE